MAFFHLSSTIPVQNQSSVFPGKLTLLAWEFPNRGIPDQLWPNYQWRVAEHYKIFWSIQSLTGQFILTSIAFPTYVINRTASFPIWKRSDLQTDYNSDA